LGPGIEVNCTSRLAIILPIEQQQVHTRSITGEEAEINAARNRPWRPEESLGQCSQRGSRQERGLIQNDTHRSPLAQQFLGDRYYLVRLESELPLEFFEGR
jgi:hypothetical protein